MKVIYSTIIALGLLAPTVATAECGWSMEHDATMSCADGTTWDAASGTCTPTASS